MPKEAVRLGGRILDTSVIDLTVDTPPPPPRIRATAHPFSGQEERQKRRFLVVRYHSLKAWLESFAGYKDFEYNGNEPLIHLEK